jgi:serine phosphatase RsbU (regulator of sigma subunit)
MLGTLAEGASWEVERVDLAPRSVLLAYTDGVTDAVGADGRFRDEGLVSFADRNAGTTAAELVAGLDRELSEFVVGPQRDDVAVLAVQRKTNGSGPPGPA